MAGSSSQRARHGAAGSIGVCYGMLGNNLPDPNTVVKLYEKKNIKAMRIYCDDADTLDALKNTEIDLILDAPLHQYMVCAESANKAEKWVEEKILAYPGVSFKYIAVGNEISYDSKEAKAILPAMENIYKALHKFQLHDKIKVSTALKTDVLDNTYPPSKSEFVRRDVMDPIIKFLDRTGGPLLANVYPYFAYAYDNDNHIKLDYALFTSPSVVVRDPTTKHDYQNLFEAMIDSFYAAMDKVGGHNVKLVISETGWPSDGGRKGTTRENAWTYNKNLIDRARNGQGTPMRPSTPLEVYIFAMFNENKKTGELVEKHFGLFEPDTTPAYKKEFTF